MQSHTQRIKLFKILFSCRPHFLNVCLHLSCMKGCKMLFYWYSVAVATRLQATSHRLTFVLADADSVSKTCCFLLCHPLKPLIILQVHVWIFGFTANMWKQLLAIVYYSVSWPLLKFRTSVIQCSSVRLMEQNVSLCP